MDVKFGAICPVCNHGNAEYLGTIGLDNENCEVDVYRCRYCGTEFVLVWVSEGKECDIDYGDRPLGGFGPYCPACGALLDADNIEDPEGKKIKCSNCGAELELWFVPAEEAIKELEKNL